MSQKRKSTKYPPTEGETEDTSVIVEPTSAVQKRSRTTLPRGSKNTSQQQLLPPEPSNDDRCIPQQQQDTDGFTVDNLVADTPTVILTEGEVAQPTASLVNCADTLTVAASLDINNNSDDVVVDDAVDGGDLPAVPTNPSSIRKKGGSSNNNLDIPSHLNPSNPAHFDHFLFYLLVARAESDTPPAQNICKDEFPMLYAWIQNVKKEYKLYVNQAPQCQLTAQQILVLESLHVPLTSRGDDHWNRYYELLVQYRTRHGHVLVPRLCEIPGLGDWVTDQRRQYKSKQQGLTSQMTVTRQEMLDEIDFVWHVRNRPEWEVRCSELLEYKEVHGDCRVPQHYKPNKSLGKWVAKQREQFKLKLKGQHSFLTPYREEKLNQMGFSWHVRNSLDGEVQAVMDGLLHTTAAAAIAAGAAGTAMANTRTDTTGTSTSSAAYTKIEETSTNVNDSISLVVADLGLPMSLEETTTASAAGGGSGSGVVGVLHAIKDELQQLVEEEHPITNEGISLGALDTKEKIDPTHVAI